MKVGEKMRERMGTGEEGEVLFSFELFPPKTDEGVEKLFERMVAHGPTFCDIMWGAGGSTADLTVEIATGMLKKTLGVETMMRLTCTNMLIENINRGLSTIKSNGLQSVLALVNNYKGFLRMTGFCKTKIPAALEPTKDNDEAVRSYGIQLATQMG